MKEYVLGLLTGAAPGVLFFALYIRLHKLICRLRRAADACPDSDKSPLTHKMIADLKHMENI